MDWRQRNLMAEAIFLFEGDEIIVDLRYDDFRAKLLNGEKIEPFKDETVRGAYTAIGDGLTVEAVCLFLIQFDKHGVGQADWNLPVRELAHASGDGPDLGAGPIRLAGRGQCSIPWHNLRLWMPRDPNQVMVCKQVQAAVTRNSLGFRAVRPTKLTSLALEGDRDRIMKTQKLPSLPDHPAAGAISGNPALTDTPRRSEADGSSRPAAAVTGIRAADLRTSGAVRALKQAEESFEAAFGREGRLNDEQAKRARNLGAAIAQLRAAHARELAQVRSAHDRTVASLKAEIQRLRAETERLGAHREPSNLDR